MSENCFIFKTTGLIGYPAVDVPCSELLFFTHDGCVRGDSQVILPLPLLFRRHHFRQSVDWFIFRA